jgi:hypothetical protein
MPGGLRIAIIAEIENKAHREARRNKPFEHSDAVRTKVIGL